MTVRPWLARREVARRLTGFVLEVGVGAYGAAAALSVALSDAETVSGKAEDAVAAVPNLVDRYQDTKYVVDHHEEIQAAVDYVNQNAPDQAELQRAADESAQTLDGIGTTYDEVLKAREAITDFDVFEAGGHLKDAWGAKPDLDSIGALAEVAEQVSPFVDQVEVLLPVFYGGVLTVMDNFASDEIAATLFVMAAALGLAWVVGKVIGFWARRGRPGFIAWALQGLGARFYRDWYVRNLEHALSRPLYRAARERIQGDIVADPEGALDRQALEELERYFERRRRDTWAA